MEQHDNRATGRANSNPGGVQNLPKVPPFPAGCYCPRLNRPWQSLAAQIAYRAVLSQAFENSEHVAGRFRRLKDWQIQLALKIFSNVNRRGGGMRVTPSGECRCGDPRWRHPAPHELPSIAPFQIPWKVAASMPPSVLPVLLVL